MSLRDSALGAAPVRSSGYLSMRSEAVETTCRALALCRESPLLHCRDSIQTFMIVHLRPG